MTRRPAVFLDRDGVLNRSYVVDGVPRPPRRIEDLELLPGVEETCRAFAAAGLLQVVVTNQPDISRGTLDPTEVDAMHALLRERLLLDDVVVCPHDDVDGCPCRKPRPGMILDAAKRWDVDLNASVCVGDRWRDIEAAQRAGVSSVLVDGGHGEPVAATPDVVFGSLAEAKHHVLRTTRHDSAGKPTLDHPGRTT